MYRERHGGVDVIAEQDLAGIHFPRKQAFDSLLEQFLAEFRITLDARPDRFLDVSCQGHGSRLMKKQLAIILALGHFLGLAGCRRLFRHGYVSESASWKSSTACLA